MPLVRAGNADEPPAGTARRPRHRRPTSDADVGWVTPVAWAVGTAAVVVFALRRINRAEL